MAEDFSDILEPVSKNSAPVHDLSDILEPASSQQTAPVTGPKEYPGFKFVEEEKPTAIGRGGQVKTPGIPAHYESPTGQWVLPEDIDKAYEEHKKNPHNIAMQKEAERRYASEYPGTGIIRSILQGATIGHEPQLEAAGASLITGRPYSEEKELARRELEQYREEHPYKSLASEIGGGVGAIAAAPQILPERAVTALGYLNPATYGKAAQYISKLPWIPRMAAEGAGAGVPYGAVYASGESQAPALSEEYAKDVGRGALTGAAIGGITQPVIGALGAGARRGYQFFFPKSSNGPTEQIAEHLAASGISGQDVLDQMVPKPSNALANQGITQDDLAQMIVRRHEGASAADLAKDYNISESTVNRYFNAHKGTIEVPTNVLAAARGAAGDKAKLSMTPLEREARKTSAIQGIPKATDIDPEAALKGPILHNQQRIANHIDAVVGKDMDTALAEAHNKKEVEAKVDYNKVDAAEAKFRDETENHRRQEQLLQDKITDAQKELNRAQAAEDYHDRMYDQDKFNRMGRTPEEQAQIDEQYKAEKIRLAQNVAEKIENLNRANDFSKSSRKVIGSAPKGLDVTDIIKKYRNVARTDFGSNPEAWNKFHNVIDAFFEPTPVEEGANLLGRAQTRPDINRPINNIRDFQQARKALNSAISRETNSPDGDKYLASRLIEFKKELNERAWEYNKDLKSADKKWAEGATTEDILETAEGASLNLGTNAREQLAYFRKLNPAQKEIFRIGFAEALKNKVLNKQEGSTTITGLFMNPAIRDIVREIMGPKANALLSNIDRERNLFVSSMNALSGSRTAPMESDLKRFMEVLHGATSGLTGAPHAALGHFRRAMAYKWGTEGAAAKNALMMETNPADAIRAAMKIREAPLVAARARAKLEHRARQGAYGMQNALRSSLPYQPREENE